jgi:endonuclease YncB( thermonuclease family)
MLRLAARCTAIWLWLLATGVEAAPRTLEGSAAVREDGSIAIAGEIVRLYGIWIPQLDRVCSSLQRPTFCAPSSVLVLNQKVRGFLLCQEVQKLADGSIEAYCGQRARRLFDPREDLGAWMIQEGWALARPDAPPEYRALERIAESRELGIWGDKFVRVR